MKLRSKKHRRLLRFGTMALERISVCDESESTDRGPERESSKLMCCASNCRRRGSLSHGRMALWLNPRITRHLHITREKCQMPSRLLVERQLALASKSNAKLQVYVYALFVVRCRFSFVWTEDGRYINSFLSSWIGYANAQNHEQRLASWC